MSEAAFEAAHQNIEKQIASARERAAAASKFRQTVDGLRGVATVNGVTATVEPTGVLVDLNLPQDLTYKTGEKLSKAVIQAVRAAFADVSTKVRQETESVYGADSEITRRMSDELGKRTAIVGEPEPEKPTGRGW